MAMDNPPPHDAQPEPETLPGERRTRLSGAWTAVVIGLVALVVILIFISQNQQSVEVSFLFFSGHLPLAVDGDDRDLRGAEPVQAGRQLHCLDPGRELPRDHVARRQGLQLHPFELGRIDRGDPAVGRRNRLARDAQISLVS